MLFLLIVALVLGGTVRDAGAATIFVTVLDQRPISAGPGCSLQEAIYASTLHDSVDGGAHGIAIDATDPDDFIATSCGAGTGNDTIVLPTGAVLSFDRFVDGDADNPYGPTATPIIFSNITIEGHGATLQWMGPGSGRLFAVGPASIATPHGTASGTGNLTLRDVYVKDFHAAGGSGGPGGGGGMGAGGAIFVQSGGLTIESSTFRNNTAVGGNGAPTNKGHFYGGGGGIGGNGGFDFGGGGGARGHGGRAKCGPGAGGGGGGGIVFPGGDSGSCPDGIGGASGLYCGGNGGDVGNDGHPGQCPGGGGGGSGDKTTHTYGCGPDGGRGNYGGGGGSGRCNGGSGGFGGGGGAGDNSGGLGGFGGGGGRGSIIDGTSTAGQGGPFGGDGANGPNFPNDLVGGGGAGLGGAIFNDSGSVTIRNSTFTGNAVLPGAGAPLCCGHAAKAVGGAIFSFDGSLTVVDSTISGNTAINGDTGNVDGGIAVFGDNAASASLTLNDTIVADNGVSECLVWGSVSAAGTHNIIVNTTNPNIFSIFQAAKEGPIVECPGAVSSSDPQLGPLQLNVPGSTPTMALPFGSAAMSAADSTTSLATDQRGVPRPQAAGWDIGAYQVCRRKLGPSLEPAPCLVTTNPGPTYALTIAVSSEAAGATNVGTGSHEEPADSVIMLTATPKAGYVFVGWTGNVTDPTKPTTTIVMDQLQTVIANFAPEETGFVPPDKATAVCEDGVAGALTKLTTALVACHVHAADAAAQSKAFDEDACEARARAKYDGASAKLKGCPTCLDTTARGSLANQVTTTLEQRDAELHCAGSIVLGGDDGGFVPPDKTARKCEDAAAKSLATLVACLARCHVKTADLALKAKPFDEEACEETNVKSSCRVKYALTSARLLKKPPACPACLGAPQQATLGDEAERDVDSRRGAIYCAGTQDLAR